MLPNELGVGDQFDTELLQVVSPKLLVFTSATLPGRYGKHMRLQEDMFLSLETNDARQIFGIALGDETPPNIYFAATSACVLQIGSRGRDGLSEPTEKGQYV